MRLIDADALIKVIQQNDYMLTAKHNSMAPGMFTSGIRQAVDEAPAIDAVPEVRGEWLNFAGDFQTAEYNKCGELYDASDHADEKHFAAFKQFYKYCPNCGAKMEDKP